MSEYYIIFNASIYVYISRRMYVRFDVTLHSATSQTILYWPGLIKYDEMLQFMPGVISEFMLGLCVSIVADAMSRVKPWSEGGGHLKQGKSFMRLPMHGAYEPLK